MNAKLIAISAALLAASAAGGANAAIIGVSGGNSSAGTAPAIIAPPPAALDDFVFNTGMEGFNEVQNFTLSSGVGIDGGGTIAAGTRVDSHMIFLNSQGSALLTHNNVTWTFSGSILGIMSDVNGTLEAASTPQLGAPTTNYTTTSPGTGAAAPFANRGLESGDSYIATGNQLTMSMRVTEPGDWVRVVTSSTVPTPTSLGLLGAALVALGGFIGGRRQRRI